MTTSTPSDGTHFEASVPETLAGERIDRAVAFLTGLSRREVADLLAAGAVLVGGAPPAKPSLKLVTGDVVRVDLPDTSAVDPADAAIPLHVVYEDADVIVVDKQEHLVVHPGSGTPDGTLVNALLHRYPELAGVGEPGRPGIVHRLDKGTSGLLMVARTPVAYTHLVGQLSDRTVYRRYLALAKGIVESVEGLIDARIGRSARDATRRAVVADGREARNPYRVVERYTQSDVTLLELRLETGRTHQIRVHLEAIDHPVIGDPRYGGSIGEFGLTRPFLHAAALGFDHPTTGEFLQFESALPADLNAVLARL
ncbi:MAG: RluA family pseudouridine synthase [Acidimicrobiales bacterium]